MSRFPHWPEKFAALCFLGAWGRHLNDMLQGGWLPYTRVPLPVNLFWTSLTLLDLIAALLLIFRPGPGLLFGVAVMVADVAVNGSLAARAGREGALAVWTLLAQTVFLGFVVGVLTAQLSRRPEQ